MNRIIVIDKIYFIVLVLNATNLFVFLASRAGVELWNVSLILLAINCLYLIGKWKYLLKMLNCIDMKFCIFILLLWPLATIIYAPSFEMREIGLVFYNCTLFCCTVVYAIVNGLSSISKIIYISLIISVLGLMQSMIMPEYFETVAELAGARTDYAGRSFGYFVQPNILAISISLLFIGYFALMRQKKTMRVVLSIVAFLIVILMTGSRTGMLIGVIIVIINLFYIWKKSLASKQYFIKILIMIASLVGSSIAIRQYYANTTNTLVREEWNLFNRIEILLSFKLSNEGGIKNDTSVQARAHTQSVYMGLIKEKPLLGHGIGSDAYYKENGPIKLSSHSSALTCAMQYGIIYTMIFSFLIVRLYRKRYRAGEKVYYKNNSIMQFVFIALLLYFISSLMEKKVFYIIWGIFFSAAYYPQYVFQYSEYFNELGAYTKLCNTNNVISKTR